MIMSEINETRENEHASNEHASKEYASFKEQFQELVKLGEKFRTQKIFYGRKLEKYIKEKDSLTFYIYQNYTELYDKYIGIAPELPKMSMWYYILHHVFWLPEKFFKKVWWEKYGARVEEYMNYYEERLRQAFQEIENRNI